MIIDLETQVWSHTDEPDSLVPGRGRMSEQADEPATRPWVNLDRFPGAYDKAMSCVDVSAVLGFRSRFLSTHISAETVASFVAKAPSRRIGFAGIDPLLPDPVGEIDRAVSLGLSGVCISPALQNFHPSHSRAALVYERCQEIGLPIIVRYLQRMPVESIMEYASPVFLDEVARNFPRLKLVIGQLGWPFADQTLALIGKHENVFTTLSGIGSHPWRLYNMLMSAFECGVMNKVLFASNFPFDMPERIIERLYSLNQYSHGTSLPSIPRQQLRGIVERDALDCLGLERPEGAPISSSIASGLAPVDDEEAQMPTVHVQALSDVFGGKSKDPESYFDSSADED
ncbi:MAG: hypothetical protein D8M59_07420 [Planctomycetes bacterium]|nr:hypothetical protein [Planctomycetota bacterium]NOG53869.1 amidohydrolase family protein [Planctomycetota bacterium]